MTDTNTSFPKRSFFKPIGAELSRNKILYLMILVPLAVLILFYYIPMYGIQIAFRRYTIAKGITGSDWVGLKYFIDFFESYQFGRVIKNTLLLNLYSLAVFPLPLLLALFIHYMPSLRVKKTIQMVSYAPHFISTVVMCGLIMQFMGIRNGLFNEILGLFGVPAVNYIGKASAFRSIYVWSDVWQHIGYNSIIYIAALSGVSPELHEAAIIDGADIVKRIWHVDIPAVLPTFFILLILSIGQLFNLGFEKVLLLQNDLNMTVSSVISTYVYQVGLASDLPRYSYAAAVGLFTSIINIVLLFTVNKTVRRLSGSSLW